MKVVYRAKLWKLLVTSYRFYYFIAKDEKETNLKLINQIQSFFKSSYHILLHFDYCCHFYLTLLVK